MKIRCLSLADYTKIASYVRDLSSQMGYQKRHRDRTKGKKVKTRNVSFSTVLNTSTKWIDPMYFTFPKPGQQSMFAKAIRSDIVRMLWRSVYFNISPLRHQGKKNQDSMNMGVGSGFLPADSPNFLFLKLRSNKKTLQDKERVDEIRRWDQPWWCDPHDWSCLVRLSKIIDHIQQLSAIIVPLYWIKPIQTIPVRWDTYVWFQSQKDNIDVKKRGSKMWC